MLADWYGKTVEHQSEQLKSFSGHTIKIPPPSTLVINMTKLDEICAWAQSYKEIVLMMDGEMHRYKTEDVLEILKQIEL